jgi:hypothetical protein
MNARVEVCQLSQAHSMDASHLGSGLTLLDDMDGGIARQGGVPCGVIALGSPFRGGLKAEAEGR